MFNLNTTKMSDLKNYGLLPRYKVTKNDGTPVDPRAEYFILRYDDYGSDPKHIEACRKALAVYAEEIKEHLPLLSADLNQRLLNFK